MRVLAAILALGAVGGASGAETVRLDGRAMGTSWTVKLVPPAAAPIDRAGLERRLAARLEQLEQMFSTFRRGSEVTRFNGRADTAWQPVSPEIARVAAEAAVISAGTSGAFDATIYPLVKLWGGAAEGRRPGDRLPTPREIEAAKARVDWRALEVRAEPPALRKAEPAMAVDFSSMAKGFAADELARLLRAEGVEAAFVRIAGDIVCLGRASDGAEWRVGLEDPGEEAFPTVVALADRAVSTSGNYRNHVRVGSRRLGHILDPRSGAPVESALVSVSVVDRSGARASALATALFVLGLEEGWRLAQRENWACAFLFEDARGRRVRRVTPELARLTVQTRLSSARQPQASRDPSP